MKKQKSTKVLALMAVLALGTGMVASFAGCGEGSTESNPTPVTSGGANTADKKMVYGSAAYAGAIYDGGVDPAMGYAGWSTYRYAIGECLVTFNENMEVEPWLAKSFTKSDDKTWVFEINDGVKFHNGNACDGAAVKASLERCMQKSDRTADVNNLLIDKIEASGNTVTITTKEPNPILGNLLCDPLFCIVDASVETDGHTNVIGTGAYKLVSASDEGCTVVANQSYWNGTPKMGTIEVKSITDGDTLTMALQNGEIDAAQELPLASLNLFSGDQYSISTSATSRSSNMVLNTRSKYLSDKNVRLAIAHGIDKQDFIDALMYGYGELAHGFFPQKFSAFGDSKLTSPEFNVEKAKELLKQAGWEDTDGDGFVDKDGENMKLQYYTYSSRQDLPLLAQAFQSDMKDIGIDVELNIGETGPDQDALKKDSIQWDINVWQMVTAPNGDPLYMIDSAVGRDGYYATGGTENDTELQGYIDALRKETDTAKRAELAVQAQQKAIDEGYLIVAFHKEQSLAMKKGVTGLSQHPTDQHEINVDTDFNK
ncbi:MAG: ABC transporter substrate-binding protein [Clostridiales bacterium]|jgi:peptide/nickel transport system substrate-binding protein|nr:ABC transporter substrate-binding protein [Clostridiales bacterium]